MTVNFDEYKELEPDTGVNVERRQYALGGKLAIYRESDGELFFETRNPVNIPHSPADIISARVRTDLQGRQDMLSARHYQTPQLWWVLLEVNDIDDPFDPDGVLVMRIPDESSYFGTITRV